MRLAAHQCGCRRRPADASEKPGIPRTGDRLVRDLGHIVRVGEAGIAQFSSPASSSPPKPVSERSKPSASSSPSSSASRSLSQPAFSASRLSAMM